ncbi:MAG: ferrous iron transporter B [Chloroflexota bacterium]
MPVELVGIEYGEAIELALKQLEVLLQGNYALSRRAIGLLLLQRDPEIEKWVKEQETASYADIKRIVARVQDSYPQSMSYIVSLQRQQEARRILATVLTTGEETKTGFGEKLSRWMMNPWTGVPILLFVLYFGLYQFVGVFGAGVLVNLIEGTLFGQWLNPWVTGLATKFISYQWLQDLFVGDYGIITLGLTYAFALILPIVGTFFLVFAIIEDSGYLPRLALLIDRVFKKIGLNGRAVIPIVLGFGCDTMATIVTRTLETKKERVLATLLLALAIPCSAQMGVILAILSGNWQALFIWAVVVTLVFLLIGYLASKVIRGEKASFYMEVPPLRLPKLSSVMVKTYTRLEWYFTEVLPVFILASVLLWAGKLTGVLDLISNGLRPVVEFIGLPAQTSTVFLYGFFRRDFGAAGLYQLHNSGVLTGIPLVVAAVTLTLFVPCIAQFTVMLKERGLKTALAIALFVFPFAFLVGFILNLTLKALGVAI